MHDGSNRLEKPDPVSTFRHIGARARPVSINSSRVGEKFELLTPDPIQSQLIGRQLSEVLRMVSSIKQGVVNTSLILRKPGAYSRQNSLAIALREIGRIERTLFMLHWLQYPVLRRRVTAGLTEGEARSFLARAVFSYRLGEIRDSSYEKQRCRASGLKHRPHGRVRPER
jgi:TnpA family transposase